MLLSDSSKCNVLLSLSALLFTKFLSESIIHSSSTMKKADIISKVIEYLSKKGYSKTEAMLRIESANQDVEGRPINPKAEEAVGVKYFRAFGELRSESWL